MPSLFIGLLLVLSTHAPVAADDKNLLFPDLELDVADGGSIRLSQLKGNVVLLNVWATWCGPCRLELPIVQRFYDHYSDRNFVVLAVNVDANRQNIPAFLKRFNISLPIYYASPEDAGQMTASGIPTTYLIGPDRILLERPQVGYEPSVEDRWKLLIEKKLVERKPKARKAR